jgi:hypothetical protein
MVHTCVSALGRLRQEDYKSSCDQTITASMKTQRVNIKHQDLGPPLFTLPGIFSPFVPFLFAIPFSLTHLETEFHQFALNSGDLLNYLLCVGY